MAVAYLANIQEFFKAGIGTARGYVSYALEPL